MSSTATLDALNTIPARLEKIGVSQRFFAIFCEVNQTEMSRLFRGWKLLTGDQTEKFYEALSELEELVALAAVRKW